jgi:hypothetical protein
MNRVLSFTHQKCRGGGIRVTAGARLLSVSDLSNESLLAPIQDQSK